jgi:WXG100 family type VII secretion target
MAADQTTVDPQTLHTASSGFKASSGEVRELRGRLQAMKSGSLDPTWSDDAKVKFDEIYTKHASVLDRATELLTEISDELTKLANQYPATSGTAAGQIR